MSPAHQYQTVVVWGAPAAGKTTVGRLIAAASGGRYLSMAELTRIARRDGWLTAHEDAAGRHGVMDDAATPVLAAAVRRHALGDPRSLFVLDDVVTDAAALDTVAGGEPDGRLRLHVIELDARDLVLFERACEPFCPRCHDDPDADRLQAAPASAGQSSACPSCGGPLFIRSRDEPVVFQQRLVAYRQHRAAMNQAAARYGVRWTRIEADEPADRCAARAVEAINSPPPSHSSGPGAPAPRRPTP